MTIEEMGFEIRRTKVGDPYVSEELKGWVGLGRAFGSLGVPSDIPLP